MIRIGLLDAPDGLIDTSNKYQFATLISFSGIAVTYGPGHGKRRTSIV